MDEYLVKKMFAFTEVCNPEIRCLYFLSDIQSHANLPFPHSFEMRNNEARISRFSLYQRTICGTVLMKKEAKMSEQTIFKK